MAVDGSPSTTLTGLTKDGVDGSGHAYYLQTLSEVPQNGRSLVLGSSWDSGTTQIKSITQTGVTWALVRRQAGTTTTEVWLGQVAATGTVSASVTVQTNAAAEDYNIQHVSTFAGLTASPVHASASQSSGAPSTSVFSTGITTATAERQLWYGVATVDNDVTVWNDNPERYMRKIAETTHQGAAGTGIAQTVAVRSGAQDDSAMMWTWIDVARSWDSVIVVFESVATGGGISRAMGDDIEAFKNGGVEYFVAIEGVGWKENDSALADGFNGRLFATADLAGDAAEWLGCTVSPGLKVSGEIRDSIDPVTGAYAIGGLSFEIADVDGWWHDNLAPHKIGTSTDTTTAMQFVDSSVDLTSSAGFTAGSVAWIGGREAVLIGEVVVNTIRQLKRGHLGTQHGRIQQTASDAEPYLWQIGTNVYNWARFWHGRRVELYGRAPSEPVEDATLLWSGRLATISRPPAGESAKFSCNGGFIPDTSRMWRAMDLVVESNEVLLNAGSRSYSSVETGQRHPNEGWIRPVKLTAKLPGDGDKPTTQGKYAIAQAYRYRSENGGTTGMRSTWDAGGVQALTTTPGEENTIARFLRIGDRIHYALATHVGYGETLGDDAVREEVAVEAFSINGQNDAPELDSEGQPKLAVFENGTPARFLLDNWSNSWELNRYAVNQAVRRHPIDVALAHMMSRDEEYYAGVAAAGSDEAEIRIATGGTGAPRRFEGCAILMTSGAAKGESRQIFEVTRSTGDIYLFPEYDFTATPAPGDGVQIRNTIYDVLPIGWGMGIPWWKIDLESFESIRDKHMPDAAIGKFILGTQDKINLWNMVRKYLLEPYGITVTFSRTTGKLTASFLGLAQGDGILDDYVNVAEGEIFEVGELGYNLRRPLSRVIYKVRQKQDKLIGMATIGTEMYNSSNRDGAYIGAPRPVYEERHEQIAETMGGATVDLTPSMAEFDELGDSESEEAKFEALFNTQDDDSTWLMQRGQLLMRFFAVPPMSAPLELHPKLMTSIRPGSFLLLNKADGVVNPFSANGTRGWSEIVALVVSTGFNIVSLRYNVAVLLLQDINSCKVAPAARVIDNAAPGGVYTGSDGTSDWFYCGANVYGPNGRSDSDVWGFAVGDKIALYTPAGAFSAGTYTIRSFGTNDSALPQDADDDIIRINEAVPAVPGDGYYLSFIKYDAAVLTDRQKLFGFYADAAGTLGAASDDGKTYG